MLVISRATNDSITRAVTAVILWVIDRSDKDDREKGVKQERRIMPRVLARNVVEILFGSVIDVWRTSIVCRKKIKENYQNWYVNFVNASMYAY